MYQELVESRPPEGAPLPSSEVGQGARWKPGARSWAVVALGMAGLLLLLLYPSASAWFAQRDYARAMSDHEAALEEPNASVGEQLALANDYNGDLAFGVDVEASRNVPVSTGGSSESSLKYDELLNADDAGMMARLVIPKIDVDIPVYHGTSDETLLEGVGHLEGSHLPVGGESTHSVLTAHRGLASARMFTDLDQVSVGDTFTVEVFGEVLAYRVIETRVLRPDQAVEALWAVPGEDLVTLVTCTPLGVNSHRILVTGERINPATRIDLTRIDDGRRGAGFPWWLAAAALGTVAMGVYLWRGGYVDQGIDHLPHTHRL